MPTGKEFTIVDAALFNGARDTDGGIWVRLADDDDHRILSAAVTKQIKNTEAAKGTLSALDPNAPHLLDDILATLNRVLASVNGARPASAQLAGTPIGDALASSAKGGRKGGKKKGAKGSDAAAREEPGTDSIAWADGVPSPRPRAGDAFWPPLGFPNQTPGVVSVPVGYDAENEFFVVDSPIGRTNIVYNEGWSTWMGAGTQPKPAADLDSDTARVALEELIGALRAGPTSLEDSQFEASASVAVELLAIIAKANEREDEMRTEVEYIDEYRTMTDNAVELAGGLEYDLVQATSLEAIASGESIAELGKQVQDDAAALKKRNAAKASKKPAKAKPAAKAAAKGGAKRKR